MRTLYLMRHSLTEANERRLYCGRTDLPLSPRGRALAEAARKKRPLPECDLRVTSGMRRAEETLELMTGRRSDFKIGNLAEMDFGRFEMRGYDDLKDDADYQRWIGDARGEYPCPGGESTAQFGRRARSGGVELLERPWESAVAVCHGGTIVQLMRMWFPGEDRHFYQWQPAACGGWRVTFEEQNPVGFDAIQEAT